LNDVLIGEIIVLDTKALQAVESLQQGQAGLVERNGFVDEEAAQFERFLWQLVHRPGYASLTAGGFQPGAAALPEYPLRRTAVGCWIDGCRWN